MEDVFPYMTTFYTTNNWKEFNRVNNELLGRLERHVQQHKATFNAREYIYSSMHIKTLRISIVSEKNTFLKTVFYI